jgi:outer membrane protein assembly factor BamB
VESRHRVRRRAGCTRASLVGVLVIALMEGAGGLGQAARAAPAPSAASASRSSSTDWPAYLDGPAHYSYSRYETAITPADARDLVQKWRFLQSEGFFASPTVADGAVFIGADTGWFYKFAETTGRILARRFLGVQPALECPSTGFVSTATVAADPRNHQATVYVAAPDGYLYALRASNLSVKWRSVVGIPSNSVNNFYNWASPTVANDKVYIGISSNCDNPLVRGGVIAFAQASGKKIAEFYTVPPGSQNAGGSVWSSIAVAPDGDVFASTGNGPDDAPLLDHSESILKFSPTLRLLGAFKLPSSQVTTDGDFGASPIVFGNYVGACNKNGIFYLLYQSSMKVRWERRISAPADTAECIATPAYNGKYLYLAGAAVTIRGTSYAGSVQERIPGTGQLVWETGLPNGVEGSPTLDGRGVLAVGTYDFVTPNATYLLSAASGRVLKTVVQGMDFAQSVFANNWLFTANNNGVYAFGLRAR